MPVYRVPLTGELFSRPSMFEAPPTTDSGPRARARRAHGQRPAHPRRHAQPHAPGGGAHAPRPLSADSDAASGAPSPMPTPGLGTRRPGWPALFEAPAAAELFHAPLRKSVTGGAIKAIAIFTIGDAEMQRHWRAYAERFVQLKGGGVAFGAKTQAEVAARLNKLHNTDVANVYFIGHGYAGGTHPRNPRLFRLPTFMLSGVHNGGTFANNSDPAKNLTPEPGPLIEALAPHLSRDYAVNMYFLSCHTGTNNVMQEGMVKLVRRYAPGVAITVYGYKQYYGVEKNMAPRAHVRESKKDPPPDPNTFVAPDKVPEGYSYASYGDRFKGDDPLKEIDENRTDDPLFGL